VAKGFHPQPVIDFN
jgi:hypothetical protein